MMTQLTLPKHYNYIGVFLTYNCNMGCSYCLNKAGELSPSTELTPSQWIEGLSRLQTRTDLPITFQGGEPTLYPGFYELINDLYNKGYYMDLLTNGKFSAPMFRRNINPCVFKRKVKYASIRYSFHQRTDLMELLDHVWSMKAEGYEVGIWAVEHPDRKTLRRIKIMRCLCNRPWTGIDFRTKEYLGMYKGKMHGTYRYAGAVDGKVKEVMCKPSELLIGPDGYVYRCHADLYAHRDSIGHILGEIGFPDYLRCKHYGKCNPCDVKLKTDRFQESGHCSVEIKGVEDGK